MCREIEHLRLPKMDARSLSLSRIHSTSICWVALCVGSPASPHKSITNALYFKELGRLVCCLCPKNRQSKNKNKKQKRTAHRAGPSIGGWNFSGLWCHDGSHNPGLQLQLRGRMETRTPGLSLHSTVNVKLIKSFPKNGCTEPKFPISISEKWESCLRSQTLRADIAHFLCKKPPASSGSVEASAWVRLVVDESKHCLLRSPGSWTKGSEEQVASWGQDCCVLSLL